MAGNRGKPTASANGGHYKYFAGVPTTRIAELTNASAAAGGAGPRTKKAAPMPHERGTAEDARPRRRALAPAAAAPEDSTTPRGKGGVMHPPRDRGRRHSATDGTEARLRIQMCISPPLSPRENGGGRWDGRGVDGVPGKKRAPRQCTSGTSETVLFSRGFGMNEATGRMELMIRRKPGAAYVDSNLALAQTTAAAPARGVSRINRGNLHADLVPQTEEPYRRGKAAVPSTGGSRHALPTGVSAGVGESISASAADQSPRRGRERGVTLGFMRRKIGNDWAAGNTSSFSLAEGFEDIPWQDAVRKPLINVAHVA